MLGWVAMATHRGVVDVGHDARQRLQHEHQHQAARVLQHSNAWQPVLLNIQLYIQHI